MWAAPRTGDPGDVDSYVVTSVPDSGTVTVDAGHRHVIVDGLTNGVEYVFSVVALGPGGSSAPTETNAVTPGEDETVPAGLLEKLEGHLQDARN
ncbi:MAG: fibronectin type III domain-containing protein, partial [Chloroflexi bacterium]|nr:fibronectin type III domain-containing protein [Chloroflexota bacterium]